MAASIHSGHRARLRERFRNSGLTGFQEHEILELLLGYSIPQGDLNPLSHRLIDTFGSLHGVFEASFAELCKVEGIGEYSATFISLMPHLTREYLTSKNSCQLTLKNSNTVGDYLVNRFIGMKNEVLYAVFLGNQCKVLHEGILTEGSFGAVSINVRILVEEAIKYSAPSVIIAHNHPNGIALPSQEDINATMSIAQTLKALQINLVDHFIIGGNDYVSLASSAEFKDIFR